ncbi:MAG: hypothetical protein H7A43_09760 [Verrucomicrobia bacterium]|nr:hypothetical protein [Verrucomicrobiota bacterium]
MIDHGSGNSTARTGTGLSAHLDDDPLTDVFAVAESCDSATGDSDLPDAADVSAAVEVTAGEATCDLSAESSADDGPAFLIGGEGESESGSMESRAAKPPRRDALFAARSLEARARRPAALPGRFGSIMDRFEPIRR